MTKLKEPMGLPDTGHEKKGKEDIQKSEEKAF